MRPPLLGFAVLAAAFLSTPAAFAGGVGDLQTVSVSGAAAAQTGSSTGAAGAAGVSLQWDRAAFMIQGGPTSTASVNSDSSGAFRSALLGLSPHTATFGMEFAWFPRFKTDPVAVDAATTKKHKDAQSMAKLDADVAAKTADDIAKDPNATADAKTKAAADARTAAEASIAADARVAEDVKAAASADAAKVAADAYAAATTSAAKRAAKRKMNGIKVDSIWFYGIHPEFEYVGSIWTRTYSVLAADGSSSDKEQIGNVSLIGLTVPFDIGLDLSDLLQGQTIIINLEAGVTVRGVTTDLTTAKLALGDVQTTTTSIDGVDTSTSDLVPVAGSLFPGAYVAASFTVNNLKVYLKAPLLFSPAGDRLSGLTASEGVYFVVGTELRGDLVRLWDRKGTAVFNAVR